ncbi:MAG TPA: SLBB domain-containing protein [Holophaga sp.]|nr:SLBB domain-containing protein [Holophaga sp.]
MSNSRRSCFLSALFLVLGGALSLGAQVAASRAQEDPLLEASPVFKAGPSTAGAGLLQGLGTQQGQGRYGDDGPSRAAQAEEERRIEEIRILKEKDRQGALPRFGDDLFEMRQSSGTTTDGGVSEDYVLGTGDRLTLHIYDGSPMDVAATVDGRGMLSVPRVGSLKVAGLTLAKAKQAVQALVRRNFSQSRTELLVTSLREVRVSILGEVYKPGSYLVSSLASLVNVLSLSGGPTLKGSLRGIQVNRGGATVHTLDLYPLRTSGKGDPNFTLQSGDVVFVPLAKRMVVLEGAFLRLAGLGGLGNGGDADDLAASERQEEAQKGRGARQRQGGQDDWFAPSGGEPPRMQFELTADEGIQDVVAFAGGLLPELSSGVLSLRRRSESGVVEIHSFQPGDGRLAAFRVQRGDTLSALPRRERDDRMVTLTGWVRVQGTFARTEGLKVGDLLKRDQQILPDSYLARGEIVRTAADGRTSLLVFNVEEALKGTPAHDLPLADRDQVRIFKVDALRLKERVKIVGPLARPGEYPYHKGMRASDLIFLGGVPQKSANRVVAELARTGRGGPSTITRLELGPLLSDEAQSPVTLADDARNPLLQPDDLITVFTLPDFKVHRIVKIHGQVNKPGDYVVDHKNFKLSQLVSRAGGFTEDAMPRAGILLRRVLKEGEGVAPRTAGGKGEQLNPAGRGVDEILERLSEVKRQPTSGQLLRTPVLHGLAEGRLNRLVVDFPAAARGEAEADVDLEDGDEIFIPERTEAAYVVGETASPFGTYKLKNGMKVRDLISMAGGTTRNADTPNVRLLRADGKIFDHGVNGLAVEPGDTVLVPQRVRRDTTWQENLTALTPIAIILNALLK